MDENQSGVPRQQGDGLKDTEKKFVALWLFVCAKKK